ncbi:MAG: HAMP domain-containing protein, partial [Proteobacteria bacterium]|nr:HAMP domain-containing protein [Pseudomonadota bacterium]
MKNSSSLSKAILAAALALLAGLAALVSIWLELGVAALAASGCALVFGAATMHFAIAARICVRGISNVARAAAKGDLEPRLIGIREGGELGELSNSINTLVDATDAFVREAGAAMDHARQGKFYRKVLERGMLGSFRRAAGIINA